MIPAVMPTYQRADLVFDRGEGAYLYDTGGHRYLDFASGIAVTGLGHAHPHLVKALTEQAGKVWHVSNLYRVAGQERLAERLVAASFADSVFFSNSGAEAIECGRGRIRVDDTLWCAEGVDTPAGANVRVTGVRGTVLLVEPTA